MKPRARRAVLALAAVAAYTVIVGSVAGSAPLVLLGFGMALSVALIAAYLSLRP